jgi:hypothetical protein
MKLRTNLLFAATTLYVICTSHIAQNEKWVELFNGKDLSGWEQKGGKALYEVKDGAIVGTAVMNTPNSFLCTKKIYKDFILELDVKVDTAMNSGIQIRSQSKPDYKKGVVHGYQVEIDPSDRAWSGGIYDEQRRGWLQNLEGKPEAQKAFNKYEWNHYRIEAIGSSIKTFINGVPCANLIDSADASGFIALQVHSIGGKDLDRYKIKPQEVMWKNIRIMEK